MGRDSTSAGGRSGIDQLRDTSPGSAISELSGVDFHAVEVSHAAARQAMRCHGLPSQEARELVRTTLRDLAQDGHHETEESGSLQIWGGGRRLVLSSDHKRVIYYTAHTGERHAEHTDSARVEAQQRRRPDPAPRRARDEALREVATKLDDRAIDRLDVPARVTKPVQEALGLPLMEARDLIRDVIAEALDLVEDAWEEGKPVPRGIYQGTTQAHRITSQGWTVTVDEALKVVLQVEAAASGRHRRRGDARTGNKANSVSTTRANKRQ